METFPASAGQATGHTFVCAPMTLADLDSVVALEVQVFPAPRTRSFYEQEVTQNQYAHYLVLHVVAPLANPSGPTVVGYGGYWLLGEDAHVLSIAIAPTWQRRGLAEWIMLELSAMAWEQGALRVTLEMRVGNRAAAALYHKLGFQEVGRRKRYYRDNNEDALVLSLGDLQEIYTQQRLAARLALLQRRFQRQ